MTDIRTLQTRLGVTADGEFGPITAAAMKTALDTLDTFKALYGAKPPQSSGSISAAGTPRPTLGISTASSAASAPSERISAPVGAISMVSASLLAACCPGVPNLEQWVDPIQKACSAHAINTIRRVAAFIAQMAHESQCFQRTAENLNYSAQRLCEVWPNRFPSLARAQPYARNPEALANKVYAGRLGNGDEASGDGWRFRGGGPLQLTGRSNWQRFADAMGMPLDQALVWGRTPEGGVMAAAWFWEANDINRLADTPGVADESRRINGGEIGLADREAKFNALVAAMLKLERGG